MTSKRTITATNETGTLQRVVKPVIFARLDFSSGVQRFHTEIGPKTAVHPIHGSESYTGVGDFGGLSSDVKETTSGAPANLQLTLTGLDATLINISLTDDYFRREAEIMLGLEDASGVLLDDPEILFSGYMDKIDVVLQAGFAQMTLNLESRGTNLLTASDKRFTDEDKQIEVAGDLIGEYIYRQSDLQLRWGTQGVFGSGVYGREQRNPDSRCFEYGTKFIMADGSLKEIQDIESLDEMLTGGEVTILLHGDASDEEWFDYEGVHLTGGHTVYEDGVWLRVETSVKGKRIPAIDTFYTLYNVHHVMVSENGTIFTDYGELNWNDTNRGDVALAVLNGRPIPFEGLPTRS